MNRYLLVLFGLLTILVSSTSCTDQEEIDITYHHGITAEVNPFALYEESGFEWFDLSGDIWGDIWGIKKNLEIALLVYDKEGSLHQRVDTTVNTILPFRMDLSDLDEDKYTIVAIQQIVLVDKYDEEDSSYDEEDSLFPYRAWELENISNIKDARIKAHTSDLLGVLGIMCLGIQTQEVSIRKGMPIKIATKPAGSFVDVTFENLKYSEFNWSALCFGDQASGLYLNPELPEQGKYYYEDRDSLVDDYWAIVRQYSYEYKFDFINFFGETRFFLDSGRLNYCFKMENFEDLYNIIGTEGLDYFWQIPYDAYFEAEKGKHYKAYCYYNGETEEFTTYMGPESQFKQWYDSLDKWNIPLFEQPYVNWGASIEEVKRYMEHKHYNFSYENDDGWDSYWVSYYGKFSESSIRYVFFVDQLRKSSVEFFNENCSITEILEVFNTDTRYTKIEGFKEIYEQSGRYIYVNDLVQVEIYQGEDSYGRKYNYIDYTPRNFFE